MMSGGVRARDMKKKKHGMFSDSIFSVYRGFQPVASCCNTF